MTLALLCSGQGNQHPGMFDLTADAPDAADIFAAAMVLLDGRDPRHLVRAADLFGNRTGQILCCTQALAAHAALRESLGPNVVIAGYSVGELAGWGCAGILSARQVLDLADRRAAAMDAASEPDDGLAFVRGLPRRQVDALCAAHDVAVAIVNPGDLFVIGGAREGLQAACEAAERGGAAKVGMLNIAVASHTARLAAASDTFRATLAQHATARPDPRVRLLNGLDGSTVRNVANGLDQLARQVSQPIDWAACLDACAEAGATAALELGPGNALATMAARTMNARALDDFRTLEGARRWLDALR